METFDLVISDILIIREDIIYRNRPCIFVKPRDHHSIVLILEGTMTYTVGGTALRAETGSLLVVTAGAPDISEAEGELVRYIFIDFLCDSIPLSHEGLDKINRPSNPQAFESVFRHAFDVWKSRSYACIPQCRELLYSVINRIAAENYSRTASYYKYSRIRAAISKIETDYAQNITAASLAALCSMSTGNLARIFIEVTDLTPIAYLTRTRIENAKRLLTTGAYNITEIASLCGFSDIYSFSRTFKRICGVSPTKFQ